MSPNAPRPWQPSSPPAPRWVSLPFRPPRVRCSDADRNQVLEQLQVHHAEGRLRLDEYEQRMETALAAVYTDELPQLLAELPPLPRNRLPSARRHRHFCGDRVAVTTGLVLANMALWVIAFIDPEAWRFALLAVGLLPFTIVLALVLALPCPRHRKPKP